MSESESVILVDSLSKTFKVSTCKSIFDYIKGKGFRKKEIRALDNISFSVGEGECVGLLGLNGAGKSTLIKILTGILLPSSGVVKVMNLDPFTNRVKNSYKIGAVFGQRCQLKWDLSSLESYKLFQAIYKIPQTTFENRLSMLINTLKMDSFIRQQVRTLSLGQRMRAELAGAFLHNPKIVFLDEPTIGLDVFSKDAIIDFLDEWKRNSETTIVFTTHDMEDVKKLCNRIIVVNDGKKIFDDTIEKLYSNTKIKTLVKIKILNNSVTLSENLRDYKYEYKDNNLIFYVQDKEEISYIISKVVSMYSVSEIDIQKPQFSDVFMEVFRINETISHTL